MSDPSTPTRTESTISPRDQLFAEAVIAQYIHELADHQPGRYAASREGTRTAPARRA